MNKRVEPDLTHLSFEFWERRLQRMLEDVAWLCPEKVKMIRRHMLAMPGRPMPPPRAEQHSAETLAKLSAAIVAPLEFNKIPAAAPGPGHDQLENIMVTAELPRYRCHKEVWALKIKEVILKPNPDPTGNSAASSYGATFVPVENFAPFDVSPAFCNKHQPLPGGYYVKYADGYESYSPSQAFEEGYALIGAARGTQQDLTITICEDAADAIAQGFNYASQGREFRPVRLERAVVVKKGTEGGRPTVDFVLVDDTGQKYVTMLTGRLLRAIPCGE